MNRLRFVLKRTAGILGAAMPVASVGAALGLAAHDPLYGVVIAFVAIGATLGVAGFATFVIWCFSD